MEIKLTDNSKIHLKWVNPDRLVFELHQPKTLRDGHGYTLCGTATLAGNELTTFLAEVSGTQDTQEVRRHERLLEECRTSSGEGLASRRSPANTKRKKTLP